MIILNHKNQIRSEDINTALHISLDLEKNLMRIDQNRVYCNGDTNIERLSYFGYIKMIQDNNVLFEPIDATVADINITQKCMNMFESDSFTGCQIDEPRTEIDDYSIFKNVKDFKVHPNGDYSFNMNEQVSNGNVNLNSKLSNNIVPSDLIVDSFCDEMNLDYSDSIGNLISILSSSITTLPFRAFICIDSKTGINIKGLTRIFKNGEYDELFKKDFETFIKSLDVINQRFKDMCQKNNRHLRIYVRLTEIDLYVELKDVEYKDITYNFHFNNSDHSRIMMTNISSMGSDFFCNNSYDNLMSTKYALIKDASFANYSDIEYERRNYYLAETPKTYEIRKRGI